MKRTIALVELFLGVWLVASPWFVGYGDLTNKVVDMVAGVIVLVLAILFCILDGKREAGKKNPDALLIICAIIGVAVVVEGIIGIFIEQGVGAIVNEIIVGLLIFCTSLFASIIPNVSTVGLAGFDNNEILVINKIYVMKDKKDGSESIAMKTKAFGSMPMPVKLNAKDLWMFVGALPFDVVKSLPSMLIKGHREYKESLK